MSIYRIKPQFQALLMPLARALQQHNVHATTINFIGTAVAVTAGACFYLAPKYPILYLAIPILLFLRIASNALDGMVARLHEESSRFGQFLNEYLDRINDMAILVGLALCGSVIPIPAILAVAITPLVSMSGTLPQACGGDRIYLGIMGKPDRMFILGAASLAAFWKVPHSLDVALSLVALGGTISIFMRINTASKEL